MRSRSQENTLYKDKGSKLSMNQENNHFISSDNANEYFMTEFLKSRSSGANTITKQLTLHLTDKEKWIRYIQGWGSSWKLFCTSTQKGVVTKTDGSVLVEFDQSWSGLNVNIIGEPTVVAETTKKITTEFRVVRCTVNWVFHNDGDFVKVPLTEENLPVQEMYPWMDRSLEQYWEDFVESNASILLLIGPPGTGKTSWIKGMLYHLGMNAIVTYDPAILRRDHVFADFVSGPNDVMVIEDADNFLRSRSDGNDMMHRFLNVGSGLISNGKKKLIFSTNLPNVQDIDEALLRPGRCYDILKFRDLDANEMKALAKRMGIQYNVEKAGTMAELFNSHTPKQKIQKKVGFI